MEQIQNEQGIVLNIYDQNDNHALIKVLTNKQILYLYAKGFYKPQSKNLSQVFIGSLVNFELFCNYGSETKKLLKKAQIDSFLDFEKISQQSYQNLIHFLNLLETHNSKFFNEYVKFLKTKNLDCVDWMITYLLNFVLETKGKKLILDRCFICKIYIQLMFLMEECFVSTIIRQNQLQILIW